MNRRLLIQRRENVIDLDIVVDDARDDLHREHSIVFVQRWPRETPRRGPSRI
jgi:hypothetical protein